VDAVTSWLLTLGAGSMRVVRSQHCTSLWLQSTNVPGAARSNALWRADPSSVRTSALRDTVTASFNGRNHAALLAGAPRVATRCAAAHRGRTALRRRGERICALFALDRARAAQRGDSSDTSRLRAAPVP
jgi:hypothetical protein